MKTSEFRTILDKFEAELVNVLKKNSIGGTVLNNILLDVKEIKTSAIVEFKEDNLSETIESRFETIETNVDLLHEAIEALCNDDSQQDEGR